MRKRKIFTVILFVSAILCGCGGQGDAAAGNDISSPAPQPVLNENGREEIRLSASRWQF